MYYMCVHVNRGQRSTLDGIPQNDIIIIIIFFFIRDLSVIWDLSIQVSWPTTEVQAVDLPRFLWCGKHLQPYYEPLLSPEDSF